MSFYSTVNVLQVNEIEKGTSAKTGKPWERHTAEAVLVNEETGEVSVGKLDIPPTLRGTVSKGVYRAGFSLHVPTFGDQQGKIVSRLVSLLPVPVKGAPAAVAAAQKA